MSHDRSSDHDIAELLRHTSRVAVVGLSSDPDRPSHGVAYRLLVLGFEVVPVNPNETEVLGLPAVGSLHEVEGTVDIVDVFRRPIHAPDIARDAVEIGARALWLQSGVVSEKARAIAEEGGLVYVEDRCLGVAASLLHSRR